MRTRVSPNVRRALFFRQAIFALTTLLPLTPTTGEIFFFSFLFSFKREINASRFTYRILGKLQRGYIIVPSPCLYYSLPRESNKIYRLYACSIFNWPTDHSSLSIPRLRNLWKMVAKGWSNTTISRASIDWPIKIEKIGRKFSRGKYGNLLMGNNSHFPRGTILLLSSYTEWLGWVTRGHNVIRLPW